MATSNVDIASQALARLGEPAISSFLEDSDTAEKVNQLYEPTILGLLSGYDWEWATTRATLSEDGGATPANEWTRAFLLPTLQTDRVGNPLTVFNSARVGARAVFEYELQGKWLQTNYTSIVIEYIQRKHESLWPGYFQLLAIEALAAALALPVTENASKEQYHRQVAFGSPSEGGKGGYFGTAMSADSVGLPSRSLLDDHDPMASARFGGIY